MRLSAFTLIELLVVVVLIGILAAMVAPDYLRFRQKIDLKNSATLLQTGFSEAYSLARSTSRHYLIQGNVDDAFYELRECDDLSDADGYNCTTSIAVQSAGGGLTHNLEGSTILKAPAFEVRFYAPHGDMEIISPASTNPLDLTLDNQGLESKLYIYEASGLVTTDQP